MQTPTFALPVEAAAEEAATEEAAVEEAAVELEEPPQAVRTPAAPTTAEAFMKSRREIIFIILFSFIRISQQISETHQTARFVILFVLQPSVGQFAIEQIHKIPQSLLCTPHNFPCCMQDRFSYQAQFPSKLQHASKYPPKIHKVCQRGYSIRRFLQQMCQDRKRPASPFCTDCAHQKDKMSLFFISAFRSYFSLCSRR